MGFEEFFEHSFMMITKKETSRPVTVPKSKPSSPISCSPSIQSPASYGSPVIHEARMSPCRERFEEARVSELKGSPNSDDSSPDNEVEEGFVVINSNAKIPVLNAGKVVVPKSKFPPLRPEPVPVPGRKDAFDRIQRSINKMSGEMELEQKKDSSLEHTDSLTRDEVSRTSRNSESGSSVGSDGSGSRFDVAQFSPPDIKFFIGTPPGASGRSFGSNSSLDRYARRQSVPVNFNAKNFNVSGQQIQHSPTASSMCKAVTPVRSFGEIPIPAENLGAFAPWIIHNHPQNPQIGKRNSFSGLQQRAITYTEGLVHPTQQHPNPYNAGCQYHLPQQVASCCCGHRPATSPSPRPISVPFASPPHMEQSAMTFIPPELPAETLLDKEHNETLAKLNYVLALVECIMDLAEKRENPLTLLTESTSKKVSVKITFGDIEEMGTN